MMIGVAFFWAFSGMTSAVPISSAHSWVNATINQTVQLPFSLQPPSPSWEFLHITWDFIAGNRNVPVLAYIVDNCSGTALKWWGKECRTNKLVAEMYQQRADVLKNGTLVLHRVGLHDAGVYLATIKSTDLRLHATVNLTVTEGMTSTVHTPTAHTLVNATINQTEVSTSTSTVGAESLTQEKLRCKHKGAGSLTQKKLSIENMVRMVLGGLLLCFLGLLIVGHFCTVDGSITQGRKTVGHPGKSIIDWI
ncbi:uncharacterized protein LOC117042379 [Lacerta agilis]|uniref:uncharacterized protein LOC117042379 n=1 Tax=Lacerta agilis TaxID=80427 RepID=UPI001419C5AC|nr:uncharacterized protein LOC117042379 [Lacerta agilis]